MKKTEYIGGVFWVIIGGLVIQQSSALDYWLSMGPGPGFMPLWSGILMLAGGLMLIGTAYSKSRSRAVDDCGAGKKSEGNPKVLLAILVLTVVCVLLIDAAGFGLSMFALVFTLISITRKHSFRISALVSLIVVSGFYFMFSVCLRIPLPPFFIHF